MTEWKANADPAKSEVIRYTALPERRALGAAPAHAPAACRVAGGQDSRVVFLWPEDDTWRFADTGGVVDERTLTMIGRIRACHYAKESEL
jgi:hypothetical protein